MCGTTGSSNNYGPGCDAEQTQRDALEYAFKENISDGANSLQVLSFTISCTLRQSRGAGPLTAAPGLELRENTVDK